MNLVSSCIMKPTSVWYHLSKVLDVCAKSSILTVEKNENSITRINYGPLGCLLRQNILKEWLSSILNNSDVHMFSIKTQNPQIVGVDYESSYRKEFLMDDILQQYKDTLSLVGQHLPFGLAVYGQCIRNNKRIIETRNHTGEMRTNADKNEKTLLWNPHEWTCQSVAFFCPPNKSLHWFYYWQRQRYVWWRKFSAIPSHFSMSDLSQTPSGDQQVSLQFHFPWGADKLERVTVNGSSCFGDMCQEMNIPPTAKDGRKSIVPSMVVCETDLDLAVLTYLSDAFEEKWRHGSYRTVLRIHHKLAPYKVSVIINCGEAEQLKKLCDVALRLIKEFKKCGISILPNPDLRNQDSIEVQFIRFDEMGVPYTIVLTENSLKTGIAGLRNRDTTISEKVHITELTSKLLQYLLMTTNVPSIS